GRDARSTGPVATNEGPSVKNPGSLGSAPGNFWKLTVGDGLGGAVLLLGCRAPQLAPVWSLRRAQEFGKLGKARGCEPRVVRARLGARLRFGRRGEPPGLESLAGLEAAERDGSERGIFSKGAVERFAQELVTLGVRHRGPPRSGLLQEQTAG